MQKSRRSSAALLLALHVTYDLGATVCSCEPGRTPPTDRRQARVSISGGVATPLPGPGVLSSSSEKSISTSYVRSTWLRRFCSAVYQACLRLASLQVASSFGSVAPQRRSTQ